MVDTCLRDPHRSECWHTNAEVRRGDTAGAQPPTAGALPEEIDVQNRRQSTHRRRRFFSFFFTRRLFPAFSAASSLTLFTSFSLNALVSHLSPFPAQGRSHLNFQPAFTSRTDHSCRSHNAPEPRRGARGICDRASPQQLSQLLDRGVTEMKMHCRLVCNATRYFVRSHTKWGCTYL